MAKVLVVATSRHTKGGITSVIQAHESGEQWKKYHCQWIQTHKDGSIFVKFGYLIFGFLQYLFLLPFADIVHLHISERNTVLRKKPFMQLAKCFKKKTIVHFHSFSVETTIKSPYRFRYEYMFKNADLVLVLSEFWKSEVQNEFELPNDKIKVLYNPCPKIDLINRCQSNKTVLYAGALNVRKGYRDLLTAFSKIASSFPQWKLVLAGAGEEKRGRSLAKQLGIESQTIFLGWITGDQKDRAFKEAGLLCLPSYAEGFPMAVLDAWAYGLPVITTPVGGIPDVAIDGENMLLFAPGDVERLASQLERLITNTPLRRKLENASRSFSETTFNINTINSQLGNIYKNLLEK